MQNGTNITYMLYNIEISVEILFCMTSLVIVHFILVWTRPFCILDFISGVGQLTQLNYITLIH